MTKSIEICFSDLNEEMQKKLLELIGIDDPKEMNWDIQIPFMILDFDVEEGGD